MTRLKTPNRLLGIVLGGWLAAGGCGNGTPAEPSPPPAAPLTGLTIQPAGAILLVAGGDPVELEACGVRGGAATDCSISASATWRSAETSIATVQGGLARGVSVGETIIHAWHMDLTAETTAVVTAAPRETRAAEPTGGARKDYDFAGAGPIRWTQALRYNLAAAPAGGLPPGASNLLAGVRVTRGAAHGWFNGAAPRRDGFEATRQAPERRWRGIRVEPEPGRAGYVRPDWNVRDTEIHQQDGSPACTPYTRLPITRVGPGDGLDREHVVALAEAWDSRPPGFTRMALRRVAEDHDNLTLAGASANRSKSDGDAAEWQPQHNGAWMAHRIVEVKRKHDLSVDARERNALEQLLASGPDRITCTTATVAKHAAGPSTRAAVRTYRNCGRMRQAGWTRGVNRQGGTYGEAWNEAERRTYRLNTARDGDHDGHACE